MFIVCSCPFLFLASAHSWHCSPGVTCSRHSSPSVACSRHCAPSKACSTYCSCSVARSGHYSIGVIAPESQDANPASPSQTTVHTSQNEGGKKRKRWRHALRFCRPLGSPLPTRKTSSTTHLPPTMLSARALLGHMLVAMFVFVYFLSSTFRSVSHAWVSPVQHP